MYDTDRPFFIHVSHAEGTCLAGYGIHERGMSSEYIIPCSVEEGTKFMKDFDRYVSGGDAS